ARPLRSAPGRAPRRAGHPSAQRAPARASPHRRAEGLMSTPRRTPEAGEIQVVKALMYVLAAILLVSGLATLYGVVASVVSAIAATVTAHVLYVRGLRGRAALLLGGVLFAFGWLASGLVRDSATLA